MQACVVPSPLIGFDQKCSGTFGSSGKSSVDSLVGIGQCVVATKDSTVGSLCAIRLGDVGCLTLGIYGPVFGHKFKGEFLGSFTCGITGDSRIGLSYREIHFGGITLNKDLHSGVVAVLFSFLLGLGFGVIQLTIANFSGANKITVSIIVNRVTHGETHVITCAGSNLLTGKSFDVVDGVLDVGRSYGVDIAHHKLGFVIALANRNGHN